MGPSPLAGEGWVGGTNEGKLPPAGLGPSLTGRPAERASRPDSPADGLKSFFDPLVSPADGLKSFFDPLVSPADGLKSFLDPPHPASPARGEGPEEEPFRPRGFASRVSRGRSGGRG